MKLLAFSMGVFAGVMLAWFVDDNARVVHHFLALGTH